ncbi:ribosomal lysine N-methyltransferase set11 [Podospora australis]|uniref:Ribosomal lysine N-methyltransferase set11 n=1 Tax=Podospora australis TaxID=1536484 RepID=A0AAN6X2U0_9PEZI|nr:ribosomal lysine N-methyltransferase set11 [Podospora australis]
MEQAYDELIRWATDQGVELHGIASKRIPGRGMGMVATQDIKANERLLLVPISCLRGIENVPPEIKNAFPKDAKVHGILAAELALEEKATSSSSESSYAASVASKKKYAAWNAVVPASEDISDSLPLTWDPQLHDYLPGAALSLLRGQEIKFTRDWELFQKCIPATKWRFITKDDYKYHWLLVNTRTFYHVNPRTAKRPDEDHMVLLPVADLFNHADHGCEFAWSGGSCTFTANRDYAEGEEVYFSYGHHSNDFLLVEYGFVLDENEWDAVNIDDAVLAEMTNEQKEHLEANGYLGSYILDERTPGCYRTQVALRLLCCPFEQWESFLEEGEDEDERVQENVNRLLQTILRKFLEKVNRNIKGLQNLKVGRDCQREMLLLRWRQIYELVTRTIAKL